MLVRSVFAETCHRAHIPVRIELDGWERGKPAAHDITGTSPLCPALLGEAGQVAGVAALAVET